MDSVRFPIFISFHLLLHVFTVEYNLFSFHGLDFDQVFFLIHRNRIVVASNYEWRKHKIFGICVSTTWFIWSFSRY